MTTWSVKKLEEVCEIIAGQAPSSQFYNKERKGKPFLRVNSFGETYPQTNTWTTKCLKESKEGDVLFSVAGSLGFVNLGINACITRSIFALRPNKNLINQQFLFYFLKLSGQEFGKKGRGSAQKIITRKQVEKLEIPLPPLKTQKQIVARIEELFEKIDKAKELRQKAQEETEQIFQSALYRTFDKTERKWGVKKLDQLCCINPSKAELKNLSNNLEVSFVPMAAVDDITGSIITPEKRVLGEVKKGYTYFRENDVLFAKITPCMENGKSAIAINLTNKIGFGSTEFHVLRPAKEVLPKWIHFYIRQPWFRKEAKKHFTGTAGQQRVPKEFLEKTEIPFPPLSEQKKIVDYLDNLREKTEKLKQLQQKQLEELTELKQSILDKAFKGELK